MSMTEQIQDWWSGVPIATRYLFSSASGLTLMINFGVVSARTFLWIPHMVYKSFEIWRLVTPFVYMGPFGFSMLMNLAFLFRYSQLLEKGRFSGRLADYVFMLGFGAILLLVAATLIGTPYLAGGLILFLIYIWARTHPDVDMSFMFGIRFKSGYFPWVLIGFTILMGGFPIMEIAGCFIGHLYIYLKDIYPQLSGKRYLETPQWLLNLLPPGTGINEFGGVQQPQLQVPRPAGHQWGQGNRLGGH